MADVTIFKPASMTVSVIDGQPPVDQSAEVAALTAQVATDVSAAAFIQATRENAAKAGINCITIHEMQGSNFGIQNTATPWAFNASIQAALFA